MARYRCDTCNEFRNSPVCPVCSSDTREVDPDHASLEGPAAAVSRTAASVQRAPAIVPQPTERPSEQQSPKAEPREEQKVVSHSSSARAAEREPAPAPPPVEPEQENIVGLSEFHEFLNRGVQAIVVCGRSGTGKSELASGFIRANSAYRGKSQFRTQRAALRTEYSLGRTNPGEVWYQVINDKLMFLDPAGEFFNLLSTDYRQQNRLPDLSEGDFRFMQRAAKKLAGIILAVDLLDTVAGVQTLASASWDRQQDDLAFMLAALRWLRFDNEARPSAIGLSAHISQKFSTLPMLDVPVLVFFTKADRLRELTNRNPFQFAKDRLETLHSALMTHAHRYRFDFCHTMEHLTSHDQQVKYPCGVLLPMEWLMDTSFHWVRWKLPTSSKLIGGGK